MDDSRFDRLAADSTSSASTLMRSAEALLRDARAQGPEEIRRAAVRICRAQPAMGSLWNLAAAALAGDSVFERFCARARRSTADAARTAATLLAGDARRILTCSSSAGVELTIRLLRLPSVCAESRPGFEGRELARRLAGESLPVTVVSDAAIGSTFEAGDVVLVGADAIAAAWFVNKTGTGQLCAAALLAGVPAYVVAGREKCVAATIAAALRLRAEDPATLWENAPAGIEVSNPLFERVPLDRVASVITDAGVLAGEMIAAACESSVPPAAARELVESGDAFPD